MFLKQLQLTNFRGLKYIDLSFQPGINLIVGVNGVGKSSVLDALREVFIPILNHVSDAKLKRNGFQPSDFREDSEFLDIGIQISIDDQLYDYKYFQSKEAFSNNPEVTDGAIRNTTIPSTEVDDWQGAKPEYNAREDRQLIIYFSSMRSIIAQNQRPENFSIWTAAFYGTLSSRTSNPRAIADWLHSIQSLAPEFRDNGDNNGADRLEKILASTQSAIRRFLENCEGWEIREREVRERFAVSGRNESRTTIRRELYLRKREGVFPIQRLSDGERGILVMVLEIAHRLANANPGLNDPLADGEAIILIDELDLHLHPQWQRLICDRLTATFPNCQFIATTHSPIIIGEVSPELINILTNESSEKPTQSFGLDSNWILRNIMGTTDREKDTQIRIDNILSLISQNNIEEADSALNEVIQQTNGITDELQKLKSIVQRKRLLKK